MAEQKKIFLINISFVAIIGVIIFLTFKFLFSTFLPFVIAFLIGYLVQKPSIYLSRKINIKSDKLAILLSFIFFILVVTLTFFIGYALSLKATNIFSDINGILSDISETISIAQEKIFKIFENSPLENNLLSQDMVSDFMGNLAIKTTTFFSRVAGNFVKKTPAFLFGAIVTLVATSYISKDFEKLIEFYRNLFGEKVFKETYKIKTIITQSVLKFIKGYLLLMLLTFLELLVGFLILRIRYAFIFALIVSLVDLLPIIGTGTVLVPFGLFNIISGNAKGFWIIILYISITLIRNFAEPKVIGKQIGINPLFTLISMFVGLKLIGFWGLILFPVILIVLIEYYKDENTLAQ